MTKTTISVQKALNELKLYDAKINRAIDNANFAAVSVKGAIPNSPVTIEKFKSNGQGSFDSITKLISNRNKIKAAVILSNAKTEVTIGDSTMTVAEAIEHKDSIKYEENLLRKLRADRLTAQVKINRLNEEIDQKAQRNIEATLGGADKKGQEGLIDSIKKAFEDQKAVLVEGVKDLDDKIDAITEKQAQFLSDVDFVLTESNVKTDIELDLDEI